MFISRILVSYCTPQIMIIMNISRMLKIYCWLTLMVTWSGASESCPCEWEEAEESINCQNSRLKKAPSECFLDYPNARQVNLSSNLLDTLDEHDFEGLLALENLWLDNNKITTMHSNTFHNLTHLISLSLDNNQLEILPDHFLQEQENILHFSATNNNIIKLPKMLFSEHLAQNLTVDLRQNLLRVVPCSAIAALQPPNSILIDEGVVIWAHQMEDVTKCSFMGLESILSECMPVNSSAQDIDCSEISQEFSPLLSALVEGESKTFYNNTEHIIFCAELEDLMGDPPAPFTCLPDGLDVTNSFPIFHQYIADLQIETLYFDLADLVSHTSHLTNSVTIFANTVVLSRPLPPIHYHLKLYAQKIVLAYPICMSASTTEHPPTDTEAFYEMNISAGMVNNATVVKYNHALVSVVILDGINIVKAHTCQELLVFSDEEALEWVKASQLWLTLYCGYVLLESGETVELIIAKELSIFIIQLTTNWTQTDMIGTRQWGNKLFGNVNAALSNISIPRSIPYMSVNVYSEMIPYLASNIAIYKEAHDNLKQKMMINAERLFDMNIHFEERKADLEFMHNNAEQAVDMAETVHDAHSNQLSNHISWATTSWEAIMDINNNVIESNSQVFDAIDRVEKGVKAYKRRERFVSLLNVSKLFYGGIMGRIFEGIKEISDIIKDASEFKDIDESVDELTEKMDMVNEMMSKVEELMATVPPVPPPEGDQIGWLLTFNDSSALESIASQASISADIWESISTFTMQCLKDEDFTDKIDGVKNLKEKINELSVWCQALGEQIEAFCKYVATTLDEVNNVVNDASAVEDSKDALDAVEDMLEEEALTEENFKLYIVEQNIAFFNVMMKMFLKSRTDILAINLILVEYCSAYFYAFFKECDPTNRPSFWDNYDEVLYKLNQVQFETLNSISSLNPPPQPFQKYITVVDSEGCEDGISVTKEEKCPVSALALNGYTTFNLTDYWGPGFSYAARIRMDRLRIYLQGLNESTVTVNVKRPAIFEDTYQGNKWTFRGHLEDCRVIYEDTDYADIEHASFVTDCSTETAFQQYYYRTSPNGRFTFVWDDFELGANYSRLTNLQLFVEGSWIPNI